MFVGFDLEIAKEVPSRYLLTNTQTGKRRNTLYETKAEAIAARNLEINPTQWRIDTVPDDFMNSWPLGISCAATTYEGGVSKWYEPNYGPQLSTTNCSNLVNYLCDLHEEGEQLVTWNGTRFDWHVLAYESGMVQECIDLAMNSVDLMFIIMCHKGFFAKLDNCARMMVGEGKPDDIDGALAPTLWKRGEYQKVLDYVCLDSRLTAQVAQEVAKIDMIAWTSSSSGKAHSIDLKHLIKDGRLPTVAECLERIPLPDTSWMDNPPTREDFFTWMEEYDDLPF